MTLAGSKRFGSKRSIASLSSIAYANDCAPFSKRENLTNDVAKYALANVKLCGSSRRAFTRD